MLLIISKDDDDLHSDLYKVDLAVKQYNMQIFVPKT